MKKMNFSIVSLNIKKNTGLLFSTVAMLCLFLLPSFTSLVITVAIFAFVTIVAAFDVAKTTIPHTRGSKIVSILLCALVSYTGWDTFNTAWYPSSKVMSLAERMGISPTAFLMIVGAVGCVAGFYAMYVFSSWIVLWFEKLMQEQFGVQEKNQSKSNLKRNIFFPISTISFFCLSVAPTLGYMFGLLIAFVISVSISIRITSIRGQTKKYSIVLRGISLLTAGGICLAIQTSFYSVWSVSHIAQSIEAMLPRPIDIIGVISVLGAVVALYFVYVCVLVFWSRVTEIFRNLKIFAEIKTAEWIIYGLLLSATLAFMVFSFVQSQAFYGGNGLSNNIIYTSDSSGLMRGNVYMSLAHGENDLRQPLFALYAAPFVSIPYLLSRLIGASTTVQAIFLNSSQIIMLFTANFIFSKLLKLDSIKRVCFMLLTSCTYTQLLFTLMMDQYIVAYFWMALCMYLIAEKQQSDRFALWGAGGTLLTSMVLLPLMGEKSPVENLKAWFINMVKYGFEFVALMLAFCRFDVIFDIIPKISSLGRFTGKAVLFTNKIYQYTSFIGDCFVVPNASENTIAHEHISWQLNEPTGVGIIGVTILMLVIISAIWNRDKMSSRLAVGWVGFSAVILLGLGWGTQENGLILYALYFGWAFLVLLFQLVEKIESKLKIRFLIPVITVCTVAVLLIVNVPAIMEVVNFAITYYPV